MKPRKWVIVVFCCVLTAALGIFQGIRSLEKSRHIERILTQQLSASTGGVVSVGRVKLGLFSVYLQDVKASLSMHSWTFNVRDIKVSFSFIKLVKTRGDFAQSINRIILISPAVDFNMVASNPATMGGAGSRVESRNLFSIFRTIPVNFLLVRHGTITLSTGTAGEKMVAGDEVAGRLWENADGVSMELRGRMASRLKNLFLSASFSGSRNNRVSLRLDKAKITEGLRLSGARIISGVVEGAVDLSFPDSVTAGSFESKGWMRISGGACAIDGVQSSLSLIGLHATLVNTVVRLDSLKCTWNGMTFSGHGDWDAASIPAAQTGLQVEARGIKPDLLKFLPAGLSKNMSGTGLLELKLVKEKGAGGSHISLQENGLGFAGQPPLRISGTGRVGSKHITIDSVSAEGPGLMARGSGSITFAEFPAEYAFSYICRADSLRPLPALQGQIIVTGAVRGTGADYSCDAVLSGRQLAYDGIAFGSPDIVLSMSRGKPLSFFSAASNTGSISLSGMIDSIGRREPLVTCNISLGTTTLRALIARISPYAARETDSAWANAVFKGTASAFSMHAVAGMYSPFVRGTVECDVDRKENEKSLRWRLSPRGITVSDSVVVVSGHGKFTGDSLLVDSLMLMSGVKASGLVRTGPSGDADLIVRCRDVSLPLVNTMFLGGRIPLKNGTITGTLRIGGPLQRLRTDSDMHVRAVTVGVFSNIETDMSVSTRDTLVTVMPMLVRQGRTVIAAIDTITNRNGLRFSGTFRDVDFYSLIKDILPDDFVKDEHAIRGRVSGRFFSTGAGAAASVSLYAGRISIDNWALDSIVAGLDIGDKGITLRSLSANDSIRSRIQAGGFIPWSVFSDDQSDEDTLQLTLTIAGDLIASVERNLAAPYHLPIAGHGIGTVEIGVRGVSGNIQVTRAVAQIPQGILRVKPYVPDDIKDFSLRMTLDNTVYTDSEQDFGDTADYSLEKAMISTALSGTIGRRPVRIYSTHVLPSGFEPLTLGFLDFGALLVSTPRHGVDIHVPGVSAIGAVSDVEFAPKAPWPEFSLSGPVDKLCISGVWILRTCDITFPILDNEETRPIFDPFPYITWNFDLRTGNRNVKYYYDTGKNRNLMRLAECYLDPVSVLSFRGRDLDGTFKLLGGLRSSKGSVFFSRTFDRNLDIGLDFVPQPLPGKKGFDNAPIIWGSAEAISDSSRFDRIKLTLITRDSVSGAWSEKGRFYDIHFRVGSDIEELPGETQQRFVAEEKKRYGSVPGAGTFVSTVGEQYIHRLLFQNLERRLAKSLGLDVITIETSIASNYFNKLYNRQFEVNRWDYLALANVGITLGRYILYDKVFLKWRTELVPIDTLLQPQYNVGFEFQPLQYFLMDVNYGIHVGDKTLEYNPHVNLELRLPIKNIRKYLDF